MATPLTLVNAREEAAHREWLGRVYAFYLHDLSQFAEDEYRLSSLGRWEPDHLPYWLEQPFCHPLVLLRGSTPAGFAFVGQAPFPFMSDGVQYRLSEFFVLRAQRRSGIGRGAARAVLARFPGSFELTVLEHNLPALAFWRAVLPGAAASPVRESLIPGLVRFAFTTAADVGLPAS
jgi:predicted acetyltransferase